jgi:bifunctional DNA-binding transcriptional regulator/antitoxin component of YhaV-PrlF toxin-antitoxin module
VRIASKGQLTLPMAIREPLRLMTNTDVEFSVERDGVGIVQAAKRGAKSAGRQPGEHMRARATSGVTTNEIMRLLRVEAATLVDSSVLIHVLTEDQEWCAAARPA